jgi:hypothetical protein
MTILGKPKYFLYSLVFSGVMELYNQSNNLLAFLGLWLFFFLLCQLFESIGERIPLRILFLFFMAFQLLFTSYLAYFVYPEFQYYKMVVTPDRYYGYIVPAILAFAVGLYWKEKRYQDLEAVNLDELRTMAFSNPGIAYFFLIIGVLASFAGGVFDASGVAFILYVLSLLKFVGLFLVILGNIKIKKWLVISVYASIVISSFREAMFHDLIIWSIFLFAVLGLKYKPSVKIKLIVFTIGIIVIVFIQSIKATYRDNLQQNGEATLDAVVSSTEQVQVAEGGVFSLNSVAPQISRFNQGWIIASILDNVPNNVPYAEGETVRLYVEAAFLPRAWAPNKLRAGDKDIFNKYSGRRILEGTSMALSSVGDAYINYGVFGGWVFMFIFGWSISTLMNMMSKRSQLYPFLPLFALVIFAYAIRIECEMQTIMGHIVKSSVILWIIFTLYQRMLRRYFQPVKKITHSV